MWLMFRIKYPQIKQYPIAFSVSFMFCLNVLDQMWLGSLEVNDETKSSLSSDKICI